MAPHALPCQPTASRSVITRALGVVVLLAAAALAGDCEHRVCTGPNYFSVSAGLPQGYEFSGPAAVPDSRLTCVYVSTSFRTTAIGNFNYTASLGFWYRDSEGHTSRSIGSYASYWNDKGTQHDLDHKFCFHSEPLRFEPFLSVVCDGSSTNGPCFMEAENCYEYDNGNFISTAPWWVWFIVGAVASAVVLIVAVQIAAAYRRRKKLKAVASAAEHDDVATQPLLAAGAAAPGPYHSAYPPAGPGQPTTTTDTQHPYPYRAAPPADAWTGGAPYDSFTSAGAPAYGTYHGTTQPYDADPGAGSTADGAQLYASAADNAASPQPSGGAAPNAATYVDGQAPQAGPAAATYPFASQPSAATLSPTFTYVDVKTPPAEPVTPASAAERAATNASKPTAYYVDPKASASSDAGDTDPTAD